MALNKTVRSVLLHKGMSDDADRFLVEPPAVDYAENLRLEKEGSLRKRKGFESLGAPDGATGDTPGLYTIGDRLFALNENGAYVYDGSWNTAKTSAFIGTKELTLETPPVYGMGHIDAQPLIVDGAITSWTVVYEVLEGSSQPTGYQSTADKHVVVAFYDTDNNLLKQTRIENAHSPKVRTFDLTHVVVYYDVDNTELVMRLAVPSAGTLGSAMPLGITPNTEASLKSHGSRELREWYGGGGTFEVSSGRLGETTDGFARYHIDANDTRLYVLTTESNISNPSVWLHEVDITGTVLDSFRCAVATDPDGCEALDVKAAGPTGVQVVHCLYAQEEVSAAASTVLSAVYYQSRTQGDIDTPWAPEQAVIPMVQSTVMNGQIAVDPDSADIAIVTTEAGSPTNYASPDVTTELFNWLGARPENGGVKWGTLDGSTFNFSFGGKLLHHRLTTRAIFDGTHVHCGVQQWFDATSFMRPNAFDDVASYLPIGPAAKPVTTSLVRLTVGERAEPIAALDAGEGQHTEPTEAMLQTHVGSLIFHDDAWYASNRVILTVSSASMYYDGLDDAILDLVPIRVGSIETASNALARIHRVNAGIPYGASFGDGVLLGTALPLWFDGEYYAEASPLDTPEIIRVEDAWQWANNEQGEMMYLDDPGHGGVVEYRQFVVIVGYTDQRGNTHRSAPSSTLWVNRIVESEAENNEDDDPYIGEEVVVTFTAPLTVLSDQLSYFVELYVSDGQDDDPVLCHTQAIPLDDTGDLTHYQLTARLIRMYPEVNVQFAPPRIPKQPERTTNPPYTKGGYLASDPWPALKNAVVTSTRLWCIDASNRGRVIPSKLFEDYIAPEYNQTLAINLGDERNLTAIGKLDDKVVVFEPNDIHVIYGDGPDNRGQGQDFAVHYISTDVGCRDQESVIETPVGLIFYSKPRGFYMLDRNLQVRYIGGGVEDTTRDIDILSATLVQDNAEVRFAFTGGPTEKYGPDADTSAVTRPPRPVFTNIPPATASMAVYNYEQNAWTLFSNVDAQAAAIYQQKYTILRSDWSVWQESDTEWTDPSGDNLILLRTPWIRLSEQIQGYNRLWEMEFLGRYYDSLRDLGGGVYEASNIGIRIAYDYESTFLEDRIIPFQQFGYNVFDSTPKRAERMQFRIAPHRGRCQAIKLEIYQLDATERGEGLTYKAGPGFELSAIDFHVGVSDQRSLIPESVKF